MFIKAIVLLLYMTYPSLARQSFAFWHCVGIKGRCIHSVDEIYCIDPDIAEHVCESMEGYAWKGDSDHGYGDYLFMATELQCWDQRHLIYLFMTLDYHTYILYVVIGLPLIAFIILWRHRRSGNLKNPEILFCYGLLRRISKFYLVVANGDCLHESIDCVYIVLVVKYTCNVDVVFKSNIYFAFASRNNVSTMG